MGQLMTEQLWYESVRHRCYRSDRGCAVPALVAAGHQVTALARSDAKAHRLRSQGATPVSVSLFDRRALAGVFDGHDAVVNLATALPPTARFMFRSAWSPVPPSPYRGLGRGG